jgi:hypothetical protein
MLFHTICHLLSESENRWFYLRRKKIPSTENNVQPNRGDSDQALSHESPSLKRRHCSSRHSKANRRTSHQNSRPANSVIPDLRSLIPNSDFGKFIRQAAEISSQLPRRPFTVTCPVSQPRFRRTDEDPVCRRRK